MDPGQTKAPYVYFSLQKLTEKGSGMGPVGQTNGSKKVPVPSRSLGHWHSYCLVSASHRQDTSWSLEAWHEGCSLSLSIPLAQGTSFVSYQ